MRKIDHTIVLALVIVAVGGRAPALGQDHDPEFAACVGPATNATALGAKRRSCSAVIERKEETSRKRALAYGARGWIALGTDSSKAIADFDSALELDQNSVLALQGRATAFLNSGQSERALPDFDRAIEIMSQAPPMLLAHLHVGRGDAYNNLKRYDKGVADFDQALALNPANDEAMNDRAWALVRMGKLDEAIEGYDAALKIATGLRGMVLANRCEAKAIAGDIDAAIADCDAGLTIEPGNSDRLASRGFAKLHGKQYAAAIEDYDAALRLNSKSAYALFQRGVARVAIGQNEAGLSDMAAAERLQPSIRAYLEELGIRAPIR
jgi:tetratricopeptide (TPR) repeat protein